MRVRMAAEGDQGEWRLLRRALWPQQESLHHDAEISHILAHRYQRVAYVCVAEDGALMGFAEASRRPAVDGAGRPPIAWLDGIYVREEARGRGIARRLLAAVESWARTHRCPELATWAEADSGGAACESGFRERAGFAAARRVVLWSKPVIGVQAGAAPGDAAAGPPPVAPSGYSGTAAAGTARRAARAAVHGMLWALGGCALLYTDIWSGDPFFGAVLPVADVVFFVYLLGLLSAVFYRRRTARRGAGVGDPLYRFGTGDSAGAAGAEAALAGEGDDAAPRRTPA
jgi:aminoglycoside 6'-N-acetyltransferase I